MFDPVFDTAQCFVRVASPHATAFIQSVLQELRPPKSLAERNLAQLQLAERVARQFDLDVVSAVEAIAPLYASRFPQPKMPGQVRRRTGNASTVVLH